MEKDGARGGRQETGELAGAREGRRRRLATAYLSDSRAGQSPSAAASSAVPSSPKLLHPKLSGLSGAGQCERAAGTGRRRKRAAGRCKRAAGRCKRAAGRCKRAAGRCKKAEGKGRRAGRGVGRGGTALGTVEWSISPSLLVRSLARTLACPVNTVGLNTRSPARSLALSTRSA